MAELNLKKKESGLHRRKTTIISFLKFEEWNLFSNTPTNQIFKEIQFLSIKIDTYHQTIIVKL
ncbi:hypothetical protein [Tepidibacillus fermentans]|uniref:hypothetical protein n=1 Tax=Tepidibacillus fermentans TaxID=1281767 RepID=UPI001048DECF|nr:hypothetical protein [Tepidibacillus fermentans]